MEKLKIIKDELEKIKATFNMQLQAIDKNKNINKFHDYLTELISNHPNDKDIIKFIVFINDELNREQQLYNDIVNNTINQYLEKNKELLDHLINKAKTENKKLSLFEKIKKISIKDIKSIIFSIVIILVIITALIDTSLLDKIFEFLHKLIKIIF